MLVYLLQNPVGNWLIDEINEIQHYFEEFKIITLTETEENKKLKSYVALPKYTHFITLGLFFTRPCKFLKLLNEFRPQIGARMVYRAFSIHAYLRRFKTENLHIHCHFATTTTSVALILNRLNKTSYSFTAHAYDIFDKTIDPSIIAEKVRAASFVRTISSFNKQFLAQMACDESKIQVVHCGIYTPNFQMSDYSHPSNFTKIVSASNLVEKKGFHLILEGWEKEPCNYPRLQWKIAGNGKYHEILKDIVTSRQLQDQIFLLPSINHQNLANFISAGDIFLLPCVQTDDGNMDGIPVILMEAMAMGCIVISTPISGIPELIEHGKNGFLIRKASFSALLTTLLEIKKIPSPKINQIRVAARQTVLENFNIEKIAGNITDLFRNYLDHQPPPNF